MHPRVGLLRPFAERSEGIERTRVHLPRLREQEGALVELRKSRQDDPALIVRLQRLEVVRPQAENLQRPKDGRVDVSIPQDPPYSCASEKCASS